MPLPRSNRTTLAVCKQPYTFTEYCAMLHWLHQTGNCKGLKPSVEVFWPLLLSLKAHCTLLHARYQYCTPLDGQCCDRRKMFQMLWPSAFRPCCQCYQQAAHCPEPQSKQPHPDPQTGKLIMSAQYQHMRVCKRVAALARWRNMNII